MMGGPLRTLLFFALALCIHGFIASTTPYVTHSRTPLAAKNPPLYTEAPDEEQDVKTTSPRSIPDAPEYVAIGPGSVVKIEVGDLDLARKAQKKRRRSESPLLVPCSIVSVSTLLSFRWNLVYLRRKTGKSDLHNLFQAYHKTFRWTPAQWAALLGMKGSSSSTPMEICEEMFPQQVRDAYGIILQSNDASMDLEFPQSRWRAVKLAERSCLLGFQHNPDDEANLLHTGHVQLSNGDTKLLSTALRLHQEDESVQQGDTMYAVVSEFNPEGDSGEPLLKLTLKPSSVFRPTQRIKSAKKTFQKTVADLKVGDMMRGTVVRRVQNGVLIDCGVGRKGNIPVWGRMSFRDARVPMELPERREFPNYIDDDEEDEITVDSLFTSDDDDETEEEDYEDEEELNVKSIDDLLTVLEDEEKEEGEDITEFFTQNEDGSLTYVDPDNGKTQRLDLLDDDEEEEEDDDVEATLEDMSDDLGETIRETSTIPSPPRFYESRHIQFGDKLKVYVKSVGANSSQFSLTLDPSIVGMKCKDIKNESSKNKKLSRLAKQLGGFANIRKLKGQKSKGIVKATSKTGDWVYVQPNDASLPVGVATSPEDLQVGAGDSVSIQFDGVDEARGQLAIKVLDRLAP